MGKGGLVGKDNKVTGYYNSTQKDGLLETEAVLLNHLTLMIGKSVERYSTCWIKSDVVYEHASSIDG